MNTPFSLTAAEYKKAHEWLLSLEGNDVPLSTSVDVRDAGFKVSVVDTNLFPAGFNNLCLWNMPDISAVVRKAILDRVPTCKNVLILAEEHTRNTWYLENVFSLKMIIEQAGFSVKVAAPLDVSPKVFCENMVFMELETALGNILRIYPLDPVLRCYKRGKKDFELIIMNNDLIGGIPETLREAEVPIYPSPHAGWHARRKSNHFYYSAKLIEDFSALVNKDPWLYSCLYRVVDKTSINEEQDRQYLADTAADLFREIERKYREHDISSKPFVFIKADYGTYGMGVQPIEDPKDILHLNRKTRNQLDVGKGSREIRQFIVQEGVPSLQTIEGETSEVCLYQIANTCVGAFYRMNTQKNGRENLNSKGMHFRKICKDPLRAKDNKCGDACGAGRPEAPVDWDVYKILARIAGVAAKKEIIDLEGEAKI